MNKHTQFTKHSISFGAARLAFLTWALAINWLACGTHAQPVQQLTNTAAGAWSYSELLADNPNPTTYFPTTTNEFSAATFQGYVTWGDEGASGPLIFSYDYNLGYQIFSTWVESAVTTNLNLAFNGDDGHSLFVDGQFICGGGFGLAESNTVAFVAGDPRQLILADYNSLGGWGAYLGQGPWTGYGEQNWNNLLEVTPGITLNANGFPPSILLEPANLTVLTGSNAVFSVVASGTPPLAYQWQFNGTNLSDFGHVSGSVSNLLTIRNAGMADAGNYYVIVSNAHGSVTSSIAFLSIAASSALTGNTMVVADFYPDLGSVQLAGPPFMAPSNFLFNVDNTNLGYTISVTGTQIIVGGFQYEDTPPGISLYFSAAAFNGLVFTNYSASFQNVTVDPATTLPGFDASQVLVTNNVLELNFEALNYLDGESVVVLDVAVTNMPGVPPAPQFQTAAFARTGQTNTVFTFGWSAVPGWTYQVQYKDAFTQSNWSNLGAPVSAATSTATAADGLTNSQRFYRVRVLP
jgi:hypothetical protein